MSPWVCYAVFDESLTQTRYCSVCLVVCETVQENEELNVPKKTLNVALLFLVIVFFAAAAGQKDQRAATASGDRLHLSAMLIQYSQPPSEKLFNEIQDYFNVEYTIDWVPAGQSFNDKLNLVLSSGDVPDIMFVTSVTSPNVLRAAKGGLFADLTPVLGDFSRWPNLAKINPGAWQTSKVDGKNYLFPRSRGSYDMPLAFLRGDWLDATGMEVPTTLDEFVAYLRGAVRNDMGEKGTIGATNLFMGFLQSAFGPGSTTPVRPEGATTGIVPPRLTESYALALEFWQGLYAEGLVSREYAVLGQNDQEDLFVTGKSAYYTRNIWHRRRMDNILQDSHGPDAYAALLSTLEGPDGHAFQYDRGYAGGLVVSSRVSDSKLERIVAHFDRTSDTANFHMLSFGIEGRDFNMVEGFPQFTDEGRRNVPGNAIEYPFVLATYTYQKVDSPLADAAYNLATREMTSRALDPVFAQYPNPHHLDILQSSSWATFWARMQDEFAAVEAEVVTGRRTIDQFRPTRGSS